jgi:hypothetical protein
MARAKKERKIGGKNHWETNDLALLAEGRERDGDRSFNDPGLFALQVSLS